MMSDQKTIIHLTSQLEEANNKLRLIEEIVDNVPELNICNYDIDQVAELNNGMIEIWNVLQQDYN